MAKKKTPLPPYIMSLEPNSDIQPYDSCFLPKGFMFPESRDDFKTIRTFPLSEPYYAPASPPKRDISQSEMYPVDESVEHDLEESFDSTILRISEEDELLLNVQELGLQFTIHVQNAIRDDLVISAPKNWDRTQSLLTNIPVFTEELCQWHYPIAQSGYNSTNIQPPASLDIANNMPKLFGYLPNGDLAIYWELAETLSREFSIDIEPLHTTVEKTLVLLPGLSEEEIYDIFPIGAALGTGLTLDEMELYQLPEILTIGKQKLGRFPIVLRANPDSFLYYRLKLPVIQCEWDCNTYAKATWGAIGFSLNRLAGFDFKVVNNPFSRNAPIFATEYGNVIVSQKFYERLKNLHERLQQPLLTRILPIQRIP